MKSKGPGKNEDLRGNARRRATIERFMGSLPVSQTHGPERASWSNSQS